MDQEAAALLGVMSGTTGNVDTTSAFPVAGQTGVVQGQGVGQHGVSPMPMTEGLGGMFADSVTGVWDWLNKPFTSHMSPIGVFALVGVVIVAVIVWNLVLMHIRIAAEAI